MKKGNENTSGGKNMGTQKQYTQEFKQDAVNYRKSHPELSLKACADSLGISHSSLKRWCESQNEEGKVVMRGSGNYSSDEAKEIARLKRELKNTQDALEILKKAMGILSK